MFIKQIKKVLDFKKDDKSTLNKVEKGVDFISQKMTLAISESKVIAEKLKDLHKTNYDLGLTHLNNGNFKEAIFRFKIVRRFWPKNYECHLKLIYCYFVREEAYKADRAIERLLILEPAFKGKIENARVDASFKVKANKDILKNKESADD
jgi:Flp pilus assembly protein TadD